MSTLFPSESQNESMRYTISDINNNSINNNNSNFLPQSKPTYRKTYSNLHYPYCQLIKKKVIYANSTKEHKVINVTSMNQHNLKVKHPKIEVKPYSNAQIPIRMFFDHTVRKNTQVFVKVDDGKVIEELVFVITLVQ